MPHQTQQLVCLPSVFPRYIENFHAVTYINLAVIWVFLSRYIRTLYYMDCTCLDLDDAIVENWLILDVKNVSHFLDVSHSESQRLEK